MIFEARNTMKEKEEERKEDRHWKKADSGGKWCRRARRGIR